MYTNIINSFKTLLFFLCSHCSALTYCSLYRYLSIFIKKKQEMLYRSMLTLVNLILTIYFHNATRESNCSS